MKIHLHVDTGSKHSGNCEIASDVDVVLSRTNLLSSYRCLQDTPPLLLQLLFILSQSICIIFKFKYTARRLPPPSPPHLSPLGPSSLRSCLARSRRGPVCHPLPRNSRPVIAGHAKTMLKSIRSRDQLEIIPACFRPAESRGTPWEFRRLGLQIRRPLCCRLRRVERERWLIKRGPRAVNSCLHIISASWFFFPLFSPVRVVRGKLLRNFVRP